MKRCLLVLCVLSLAADSKDPAKEDLKKLQGTWEATRVTYNGDKLSGDDTGKITMTVKGDLATVGARAPRRAHLLHQVDMADPGLLDRALQHSVGFPAALEHGTNGQQREVSASG